MNEDECKKAFSMAKEALAHISTFQTPPTPEVYEVWYRYVEGGIKPLRDQLSYSVDVVKSVSTTQLQELRQQFLNSSAGADANQTVSNKLAAEMEGLQTLISRQQGANAEFSGSIAIANDRLLDEKVTPAEIKSSLASMLRGNEKMLLQIAEMDSSLKSSKSQISDLRETLAELQKTTLVDPLTGIGNRRMFDATLKMADEPRTSETPNCLFLMDLDKFKDINDTHGHTTGDDVLRFAAMALQKMAMDATITRYGGDEFAVFATIDPDQAKLLAEDVCQYFFENELTVRLTGQPLGKLTISLGVAILRVEDNSDSWFERADKLLYSAKSGGRNRVMVERKSIA
jgi:diguanylate cyclase